MTGGVGGAVGEGLTIDFNASNPFLGDTPTHNIFNNTPFTRVHLHLMVQFLVHLIHSTERK